MNLEQRGTKLARAFIMGLAFARGREEAGSRARMVAVDEWITVHPNGSQHKGQPALIDDQTGKIKGGLGGKHNGKTIAEVKQETQAKKEQPFKLTEQNGRVALTPEHLLRAHQDSLKFGKPEEPAKVPSSARPEQPGGNKPAIDMSHPDKIDKDKIIQNRDRSNLGSMQQVQSIAQNPDYYRLSNNMSLSDGAPVVAYGSVPEAQLGRGTMAVGADGKRYQVQYAVMEADKVLTSNDRHGVTNEAYYSDDANQTRAIAGNGRIAGLQGAYEMGTADKYKAEMMADAGSHGVDPDVIKGMKNPVLVRVMQAKDITSDIGDKTNTQGGLSMTASEQAKNDGNRIQFRDIKTYEDGSPTIQSVKDFVGHLPVSEQGSLIDVDGMPTRQAQDRMKAAIFHAAYKSDRLTRLYSQASDPESRNIINALERSAANMSNLADVNPRYDIRPLVTQAALEAVQAKRNGMRLEDMIGQKSLMGEQKDEYAKWAVMKLFNDNSRSPRAIADKLNDLSVHLKKISNMPDVDMLGKVDKPGRNAIIREHIGEGVPGFVGDSMKTFNDFFSNDPRRRRNAGMAFAALMGKKYRD